MSLVFWKREPRNSDQVASDVGDQQATDQHPLPVQLHWIEDGSREYEESGRGHPFPFFTPEGYYNRIRNDNDLFYLRTYNHETLSVGTTAVGFTATTYAPGGVAALLSNLNTALMATVLVETAPIRVWTDGVSPTSTVGVLYPIGSSFSVYGTYDVMQFLAISQSGATASLDVQFARRAI